MDEVHNKNVAEEDTLQKSQDNREWKAKEGNKNTVLGFLRDLTCILAGVILVFLLVFRVVVVSGSSMNNTLVHGDYLLLLNNVFYPEPKQGDIIVASKKSFENGDPIIKRVIATEGQRVQIAAGTGIVMVDGVILKEDSYISSATIANDLDVVVEPGCVFVMGDNRMRSKDSRSSEIGQIDEREILGKALFLFCPGKDPITKKMDFSRIGGLG